MTRHTDDLKQQIERILHWEQSSHWRPRDFAHLSDLVLRHTNRHLDAQALQAFWLTTSSPPPELLDALAQFADYRDWEEFCTRNFYGVVTTDEETNRLHAPMWEIPMRWVIIICWVSVIASVVVGALLVWKH